MTIAEKRRRDYRLPETATEEDLGCRWSNVVKYGNRVILAGHYYNGRNKPSFFGAVYTYTTDDHSCEGEIRFETASGTHFEDAEHAYAWAMNA